MQMHALLPCRKPRARPAPAGVGMVFQHFPYFDALSVQKTSPSAMEERAQACAPQQQTATVRGLRLPCPLYRIVGDLSGRRTPRVGLFDVLLAKTPSC